MSDIERKITNEEWKKLIFNSLTYMSSLYEKDYSKFYEEVDRFLSRWYVDGEIISKQEELQSVLESNLHKKTETLCEKWEKIPRAVFLDMVLQVIGLKDKKVSNEDAVKITDFKWLLKWYFWEEIIKICEPLHMYCSPSTIANLLILKKKWLEKLLENISKSWNAHNIIADSKLIETLLRIHTENEEIANLIARNTNAYFTLGSELKVNSLLSFIKENKEIIEKNPELIEVIVYKWKEYNNIEYFDLGSYLDSMDTAKDLASNINF